MLAVGDHNVGAGASTAESQPLGGCVLIKQFSRNKHEQSCQAKVSLTILVCNPAPTGLFLLRPVFPRLARVSQSCARINSRGRSGDL